MKKHILTFLLILFSCGLFAETNIYSPSLASPSNNAVNITPAILLNWNAVSGAWNYKVQVSKDSTFSNPLTVISPYSAVTYSYLDFGTRYFWRVKALGTTDSSDWSVQWSFTTIDIVTLTSPADSAINQFSSFKFGWTALAGATGYDWEVDSAATFDSPYYTSGVFNGPVSSGYTSQLRFGQKYFLRIRAFHDYDTSGWSLPRMVTTIDTLQLLLPLDNFDTIHNPLIDIRWKGINAPLYEVALAFDAALTDPVTFMVDTANVYFVNNIEYVHGPTPLLLFGKHYYWSVRAINEVDTTSWMTPRSFLTVGEVTLLSPGDSAMETTTYPEFKWMTIYGIDSLLLQFDTSAAFTSPVEHGFDPAVTSYNVLTELLPFTRYYWRVIAFSAADTTDGANIRTFTTTSPYGVNTNSPVVNSVTLYPNPCRGRLNVELDASQDSRVNLSLTNILGLEVLTDEMIVKPGTNTTHLNFDDLGGGIYMLRIQNGSQVTTRKVIIDK